ncbi:MAG: hypothetical protein IJ349_02835 [Clostridia bacterium]|nr:hypothetical protein [Clostridia bacterium]
MKKMSVSAKTALGAMITALSVVILIPSAVQVFVYTLPAMAGMLTMLAVVEIDKKWAIGSYVATSLIGLLFVANKEAVVYYVAFFGYYPVVKALLESKMPRVAEYILKFLVFNVSIILSGVVLVKVFGMPYNDLLGIDGESAFFTKYALPIMLGMGNVVFILYDVALTRLLTAYVLVWQKRFRKLFKF